MRWKFILVPFVAMLVGACTGGSNPQEPLSEPDAYVVFTSRLRFGSADTSVRHMVMISGASIDSIPFVEVNGVVFPDTLFGWEMFISGASMDSPPVDVGDTIHVRVGFLSLSGEYMEGEAEGVMPPPVRIYLPVVSGDTVYLAWSNVDVDGYGVQVESSCSDTNYAYYDFYLRDVTLDTVYSIPADSICPYDTIVSGYLWVHISGKRGPIFTFEGNFRGLDGRMIVETMVDSSFPLPLGN